MSLAPYYADDLVTLFLGDCLDVLAGMEADSVDAIVTDPPAGIAFMDREWDDFRRARNPADAGRDNVFGRTSVRGPEYGRRDRRQFVDWLTERMAEAYRVLKPGGHALVWSIPRTSHWTAWALEDAGFDLRDCVLHLFGSGFPKSLDVSKAIDKAAGTEREVVGASPFAGRKPNGTWTGAVYGDEPGHRQGPAVTIPATGESARWSGWGTSLKPGQEMWWLVRKPLARTVAANVLEYGTGALNIAACHVGSEQRTNNAGGVSSLQRVSRVEAGYRPTVTTSEGQASEVTGRWPPNIVLTHSAACELIGTRDVKGNIRLNPTVQAARRNVAKGAEGERVRGVRGHGNTDGSETVEAWDCAPDCPVAELDRQSGVSTEQARVLNRNGARQMDGWGLAAPSQGVVHGDTGGASRFYPTFRYQAKAPASERPRLEDGTAHETVKPLGLISWMVRLITPAGGTVLDMFTGSGPVGEACVIAGFPCILIEQDPKSAELIMTRLRKPIQPDLFGGAA